MPGLRLRRIAPQYYETEDGRYLVTGYYATAAEAGGYGAGWRWYWAPADGHAEDVWDTKREAVEALEAHLRGEG